MHTCNQHVPIITISSEGIDRVTGACACVLTQKLAVLAILIDFL